MRTTAELILTMIVAILGGSLAVRLRIPAGALMGSMLAVAAFNVCFDTAYMPQELKFFTQVSTGAFIGAKITRADAIDMKKILKPALMLAVVMITVAVSVGLLISRISPLSVPTSLFSMAPAGIADMTMICMDFNAEPSVVALIHTVRIICTICLIPIIIRRFSGQKDAAGEEITREAKPNVGRTGTMCDLALTLLTALVCGGIGKLLGIPGGSVSFSMAGSTVFSIFSGRGYMPLKLRNFIQFFAGALIGVTVGAEQVGLLLELWIVVVLAVASFILMDIVAAAVIHRFTGLDMTTALFACAPGGATDMALIAEEMGADSPKVAGIQTIRLVGIVAVFPPLIQLLLGTLGV